MCTEYVNYRITHAQAHACMHPCMHVRTHAHAHTCTHRLARCMRMHASSGHSMGWEARHGVGAGRLIEASRSNAEHERQMCAPPYACLKKSRNIALGPHRRPQLCLGPPWGVLVSHVSPTSNYISLELLILTCNMNVKQ